MSLINAVTGLTLVAQGTTNVATYITAPIPMGPNQLAHIGVNAQTFFASGGTLNLDVYLDTSTDGRNFDLAAAATLNVVAAGFSVGGDSITGGYAQVRFVLEIQSGGATDVGVATLDAQVNINDT